MEGTPFGRYRLIELLGRGGMGEVWRSFDTATNRVVALKVLPAHLASDPIFEQRFRREAFAAAGLANPHVVPIHNFGEIDGRLYVDMRLIEGRDLQTILADGPLELARAVSIVEQVASALQSAHRIGLVHRDVKPSNILVGEEDFAYLIDFGIARAAGETKLTGTGSVIGTWAYLAPERLTSGLTDARADIYALACVLHECLTGSQPFPGDSVEQQVAAHLALPPPRPSELRGDLPTQIDAVVSTGMAKNPDERYPTANDMAKAARAAITAPLTPPISAMPTERVHYVPPKAEPPTRPVWAPSHQPSYQPSHQMPPQGGGWSAAPTQYRPADLVPFQTPVPPGVPIAPKKSRKKKVAAIAGIITVVVALVAVGAFFYFKDKQHGGGSPTPETSAEPSNSGPFTGVFSVEYGPELSIAGKQWENSKPATAEYAVRSVCGENGCLATATKKATADSPAVNMTFDDINGRWVGVRTAQTKCGNIDVEGWTIISLQPQPNGKLSGELRYLTPQTCAIKRAVTWTRIRDVTAADGIANPNELAKRVPSPAAGLHGRYHYTKTYPKYNVTHDYDGIALTDCLRDGTRCISIIYDEAGGINPLVFSNGNWNENISYDDSCNTSNTSHMTLTADYPLPQSPADPIKLLTGHGHEEASGGVCITADFDGKFERTGD